MIEAKLNELSEKFMNEQKTNETLVLENNRLKEYLEFYAEKIKGKSDNQIMQ